MNFHFKLKNYFHVEDYLILYQSIVILKKNQKFSIDS